MFFWLRTFFVVTFLFALNVVAYEENSYSDDESTEHPYCVHACSWIFSEDNCNNQNNCTWIIDRCVYVGPMP